MTDANDAMSNRARTHLRSLVWLLVIGHWSLAAADSACGAVSSLRLEATGAPTLTLRGEEARQQLLVTGKFETNAERDFTRQASYQTVPEGIVKVDAQGVMTPLADGTATVTASVEGVSTALEVKVENVATTLPINFANQIVPIFTKAGCNAGGCHGKSGGQNGFKLSLLGFEPAEDYEHLVKEARGRRVFPAAPENSLLLLKAINAMPHGGGKRLDADSDDYRLLVRWIAQGMPYGRESDPKLEHIEVLPRERTLSLKAEQQLVVLARYTDGSVQDVTRSALYEPNDKSMAAAGEDGHVTLFDQPGDVASDGALPGQGRCLPRHCAARCARRKPAGAAQLHRRTRLRETQGHGAAALGGMR